MYPARRISKVTKAGKQKFIAELIDNVKREIITKVPQMPEEWDGIELRQYIADRFAACVISDTMSQHRKRDYNNVIVTTAL
jgi:hypothetical protein